MGLNKWKWAGEETFLGKGEFMRKVMGWERSCQENIDSSSLTQGHRELGGNKYGAVRGFWQNRCSFFIP